MDWKKDEVDSLFEAKKNAARSLEVDGRRESSEADALRAVATRAVELAAARGGTMTAEQVETWCAVYSEKFPVMTQHISALGARYAVLETETKDLRERCEDLEARRIAAEEGNRELVRRAQQAESEADALKGFHRAAVAYGKEMEATAGVWRKRVEAAADELADVGAGEVGRLDIVSRVRMLKARCATLSAAGPERIHRIAMTQGLVGRAQTTTVLAEYPCSPTCTHDDAAKPGHPERMKERSEAVNAVTGAPDSVGALAVKAGAKPGREIASYRAGYEQGCDDMRAACWEAVQAIMQKYGIGPAMREDMKSSIEGAAPCSASR